VSEIGPLGNGVGVGTGVGDAATVGSTEGGAADGEAVPLVEQAETTSTAATAATDHEVRATRGMTPPLASAPGVGPGKPTSSAIVTGDGTRRVYAARPDDDKGRFQR
jgi:hypothetical protein